MRSERAKEQLIAAMAGKQNGDTSKRDREEPDRMTAKKKPKKDTSLDERQLAMLEKLKVPRELSGRMFNPKTVKNPEIWKSMVLVHEVGATEPEDGWGRPNAESCFCLKCGWKSNTFCATTTEQLNRHLKACNQSNGPTKPEELEQTKPKPSPRSKPAQSKRLEGLKDWLLGNNHLSFNKLSTSRSTFPIFFEPFPGIEKFEKFIEEKVSQLKKAVSVDLVDCDFFSAIISPIEVKVIHDCMFSLFSV